MTAGAKRITTTPRTERPPSRTGLSPVNAYAMSPVRAAGGRHRNRIRQSRYPGDRDSPYLANSGTVEKVAATANHASTRATQLYDRRRDERPSMWPSGS
jgi:hypothetical protein